MGKNVYKRRKDLDEYNGQFGLLISQAYENEQTGQIEHWVNNDILANYEEIDRRKGRYRLGVLGALGSDDQIVIYSEIGKEREVNDRVNEWVYHQNRMCDIERELRENSKKLGWKQDGTTYN